MNMFLATMISYSSANCFCQSCPGCQRFISDACRPQFPDASCCIAITCVRNAKKKTGKLGPGVIVYCPISTVLGPDLKEIIIINHLTST